MQSLPVLIIAAVTLVVLFVLAWRGGRTYCNTVCPVGTILSFFARFSWFKVHFDADKCKSCSLCSKNCKSSCIDYKTHTVDYSRCVVCGNCIDNCKFGALRYDNAKLHAKAKSQAEVKVDTSKRSFLVASAMVTTAAMAQKKEKLMDGGLAEIEDKVAPERQTPLTPPGSLSFDHFAQHCTGCQLCVSDCPNQVLRPSSDLMHLMLPVMSYERGHCRPECTRCSEVCPAGAIKLIDKVEKSSIQIGLPCGSRRTVCPSPTRCLVATVPVIVRQEPSRWCRSTRTTRSRRWCPLSMRLPVSVVVPVSMSVRRDPSRPSMSKVTKCIKRFRTHPLTPSPREWGLDSRTINYFRR